MQLSKSLITKLIACEESVETDRETAREREYKEIEENESRLRGSDKAYYAKKLREHRERDRELGRTKVKRQKPKAN